MDYENAKVVFMFVDESGDTGDPFEHPDSTDNFIINIAIATDTGVMELDMLAAGYRTYNVYKKELKRMKKKGLKIISDGLHHLTNVMLYEIVINKRQYVGPYLRSTSRYQPNQRLFRNFILKVALEYITHSENLLKVQKPIELIIDRYLTNKNHEQNLREYLEKQFVRLPTFRHMIQVDSRYCPPIQVLDIVQKIKEIDSMGGNLCVTIPIPPSLQSTPPSLQK